MAFVLYGPDNRPIREDGRTEEQREFDRKLRNQMEGGGQYFPPSMIAAIKADFERRPVKRHPSGDSFSTLW